MKELLEARAEPNIVNEVDLFFYFFFNVISDLLCSGWMDPSPFCL